MKRELLAHICFDQADVEALVNCHIPLTLVSRTNDFIEQLLPLILGLDGPLGKIPVFYL